MSFALKKMPHPPTHQLLQPTLPLSRLGSQNDVHKIDYSILRLSN